MTYKDELDRLLRGLRGPEDVLKRLKAQLRFAAELAESNESWQPLVLEAAENFADKGLEAAEAVLTPIAGAAKKYTIHCVGHGHIDMNWMWDWAETVACVNDTFTTVDRLMDEFGDFKYSQSQASVYHIMKTYLPELYERVKRRIADGRWEVTASTWVEADKNLAQGEMMCRQLLETKRFLRDEFGFALDEVRIDWECDTFGHAWTVPGILARAGVKYYYAHRAGYGPWLYWWQGKDGSRLLVFDDYPRGYNARIDENVTRWMLDFEKATGLGDFLVIYGVGDHGGGPTRRHLGNLAEMNAWPVWPTLKCSTAQAFFEIAERDAKDLPVIDRELNFVLEGCYTSQSEIKAGNRASENRLVEAEAFGLLGEALAGVPYTDLGDAWRRAMLLQFHDILPGSCTHDSAEYAHGQYQEILAQASMAKTRVLRAIADRVNTSLICTCGDAGETNLAGGGAGSIAVPGAVSRRDGGASCCAPFVVFNPSAHKRSEVITVRVWDRDLPNDAVAVTDDAGRTFLAQVTGRGHYWAHDWVDVTFPADEVPALGWRTFVVHRAHAKFDASACTSNRAGVIENEFYRVEVDREGGHIARLLSKQGDIELAGIGGLGALEYVLEAHNGMWWGMFGQALETHWLSDGWTLEPVDNGPYRASVRLRRKLNDSSLTYTISLTAGSPRIDFGLEVDWLERGVRGEHVPSLRTSFALPIEDTRATYEIPCGFIERTTDPEEIVSHSPYYAGGHYFADTVPIDRNPGEVPALRWADLTGTHWGTSEPVGITLLNDSKHGHRADDDTLSLTLLRSSADPDPLPELGRHVIRYGLVPHVGEWTASDATRHADAFNNPLNIVATDLHEGALPPTRGFVEVLTPNVALSCVKRAAGGEEIIVRLYEIEGKPVTAQVRLDEGLLAGRASAVETDLLERPAAKNTAAVSKGILSVHVPAFGIVTVCVG